MAMLFSDDGVGGLIGDDLRNDLRDNLRNQAHRQMEFSAISSSPLTRIARAAGKRQAATQESTGTIHDGVLDITGGSGRLQGNIAKFIADDVI